MKAYTLQRTDALRASDKETVGVTLKTNDPHTHTQTAIDWRKKRYSTNERKKETALSEHWDAKINSIESRVNNIQ